MAGQSALSRWTRFLPSFDHTDAAIEATDPSVSRDEFRRLRVQLVEMLCTAEDDGRKAEGLCVILDGVMVESLITLQSVPADVVPRVLASSADLANAIGALRNHDSERVRALSGGIIRGWKASVEGDIVRMTAAIAKLDALSQQLPPSEGMVESHASDGRSDNAPSNPKAKKDQPNIRGDKPCPKKAAAHVVGVARVKMSEAAGPRKTAPAACISRATMAGKQAPLKMSEFMSKKERRTGSGSTASSHVTDGQSDNLPLKHQAQVQGNRPLIKKMAPVVVRSGRVMASDVSPLPKQTTPVAVSVRHGGISSPEEMMESTKRKLREGYQEAADAKRQRKIQIIEAPQRMKQRQGKMHPIMRERSRAIAGNSTAARRSLLSSFHRV